MKKKTARAHQIYYLQTLYWHIFERSGIDTSTSIGGTLSEQGLSYSYPLIWLYLFGIGSEVNLELEDI